MKTNNLSKEFVEESRRYTSKNLRRTKDYHLNKNNDYYHITKYTTHLAKKFASDPPMKFWLEFIAQEAVKRNKKHGKR